MDMPLNEEASVKACPAHPEAVSRVRATLCRMVDACIGTLNVDDVAKLSPLLGPPDSPSQ